MNNNDGMLQIVNRKLIIKLSNHQIIKLILIIVLFLFLVIYILANSILSNQNHIKPHIPVNKDRLYADVKALASIDPPRNFENIASLNKCADYIFDQFRKISSHVEIQYYTAQSYYNLPGYSGEDRGGVYKNIICSFGPQDAPRIIIGAHYDVYGDNPGADDNASGVAGLLEAGRMIKELNPQLKYRIDLVAYSLEEPPFFRTKFMGSAIHAASLAKAGIKVKAMISLEMIGFYKDEPGSQHFPLFFLSWFYSDRANFISVVGKIGQGKIVKFIKKNMIEGSNIDVYSINAPTFLPGIDFSDHLNYWDNGFKAVMITNTSFYRNPNYHEITDTIETLNFDKMAEVVKGVYWAIVHWK